MGADRNGGFVGPGGLSRDACPGQPCAEGLDNGSPGLRSALSEPLESPRHRNPPTGRDRPGPEPGRRCDIPHNAELFFPPFTHVYTVQNQTAVAQRVTGVSTRPDLLLETPTGFTPECTVGLVLQPDDMCYLKANGMNMPGGPG